MPAAPAGRVPWSSRHSGEPADAPDDFVGKSSHLRLERLELQHERLDAELGLVPRIDKVDREASAADLFDLDCHLGEDDGVVQVGLDCRDDLDPFGERGDRRRRRPWLEYVVLIAGRTDRVLGEKRPSAGACGTMRRC
jgi:hypothetical protein